MDWTECPFCRNGIPVPQIGNHITWCPGAPWVIANWDVYEAQRYKNMLTGRKDLPGPGGGKP